MVTGTEMLTSSKSEKKRKVPSIRKKVILFLILALFSLFVFLNLGRFIDVTEEPVQADIIVSLGGDSGCRIKTALSLYKNGYSKSGKFIYTHRDTIGRSVTPSLSKKEYLLNNGVQNKNIIHIDESMITNTMEEVYFIKKYMLAHHYKSVIFVSHPQHSRRISTLAKSVANYEEAGLQLLVASCNPKWWNRTAYYMNKTSFNVTIYETGKLFYNLLKYGTPLIHYTKYSKKIQNREWDKALDQLK